MITKEKHPIRMLFFRDHENSELRPAAAGARAGAQHFKPGQSARSLGTGGAGLRMPPARSADSTAAMTMKMTDS
jgi:hypothetical protein